MSPPLPCPAGGPTIPLKYGRVDAAEKDDCVVDGKLPSGDPESTHKQSPADHLRKVFYRMGLNDKVRRAGGGGAARESSTP